MKRNGRFFLYICTPYALCYDTCLGIYKKGKQSLRNHSSVAIGCLNNPHYQSFAFQEPITLSFAFLITDRSYAIGLSLGRYDKK
jgi:hypothetical protein